ncbi:hypothetical protein FQR65_LT03216 [Abscondita terminalis]|nr:hypothetical protein FQR65_LT03216 [Abscondita terminalis]
MTKVRLRIMAEDLRTKVLNDSTIDYFLTNVKDFTSFINNEPVWEKARTWVSKTQLYDYMSPDLGNVLYALKTAKIIKADVDTRGTQLKLLLTLQGQQQAVFKPKWYPIDKIIDGPVYGGKDRYGSEILAFYLSKILRKPLTAPSAERNISLDNDIIPVATKRLLSTIFNYKSVKCLYGRCFYCKKEDPVCEDDSKVLTGAIILNVNATLRNNRSPWQRTYRKGKLAQWELREDYCRLVREKITTHRLLDLVDASIFDFLIQNGDRHHYETLDGNVVLLDNGKGLGNPYVHHLDILAPLYQCCTIRNSTWKRLKELSGGLLKQMLISIPNVLNYVTKLHLNAIEQRLYIVYAAVEFCQDRNEDDHNITPSKSLYHQEYKCLRITNTGFGKTNLTNPQRLRNEFVLQWFLKNKDVHFYSTHTIASSKTDSEPDSSFKNPKNVLHNCFDILSHDLKQKDLKLTPIYKSVKSNDNNKSRLWMCIYNLKWPETMTFSTTASTKQEASNNAAKNALTWLFEKNKITHRGQPIIYDNKELQKIKNRVYPLLEIDDAVISLMNKIENYNEFLSSYDGELVDNIKTEKEEWPTIFSSQSQRYYGLNHYLTRDPALPISQYKDVLVKMLENHDVVIVKGEPACGKSTCVPQYVLEAWAKDVEANGVTAPCRIVVTEPRRIAAISLAERVSNAREENVGSTVGYQVRLKSNFNKHTGRILFCTTGILLRHIQCDPRLQDITHVIVDEAHERDVNVDLLLNLLRHALKLNPNLKVIIMSATIDVQEFQKYFDNAPILHIPGFTYTVKEHYLTDKQFLKSFEMCNSPYANVVHEDVASCINYIHKNRPEGAILCFLPGWDDIMKVKELIPRRTDLYVLCLHSRLDMVDQQQIFRKSPPGVRKIILSTNIAETSVTIDDVVYVVDTGIHKEQRLDVEKGIICIDNHWISKASALQRKGRAGRIQPGECFHLYTKSKFNDFIDYSIPEILRTSLTKIVLDSKVYSNNMNAIEFLQQLICPPDEAAVNKAVDELKELEMLDHNENLTPLGRTASNFQLPPKLSKAMVNSIIFKCVTPIVDIITLYSTNSALFSKALVDKDAIKRNMETFSKNSDHLALMTLFEKWLHYVGTGQYLEADTFCDDFGIVQPKLRTLQKLRNIHFEILHNGLSDVLPISDDFSDNYEMVKGVLLSGVGNVLQQRSWDIVKGRFKNANVLVTKQNQKATVTSDSINSRKGDFPGKFLVYINETVSNLRHTTLVRETSSLSPLSVLLFTSNNLIIQDVYKKNDLIDDQVLIKLDGTKMGFLCGKRQAETVIQVKEVLNNFRKYYTYQLTSGNSYNLNANKYWQDTLKILDEVLNRVSIKE